MNIFTLYAALCIFSATLTNSGFPTQKIDYQKHQIVAASVPSYELSNVETCIVYYVEIHYNYETFWYATFKETIIFDSFGKLTSKNLKLIYDIEKGFPEIFKPIIKKVREINTANYKDSL